VQGLAPVPCTLLHETIRALVFVGPAVLSLARRQPGGAGIFASLRLSGHVWRGIRWGLIGGAVYVLFGLVRAALHGLPIHAAPLPPQKQLSGFLLVPLVEEIAFRGFVLERLRRAWRFWIANGATALLFVAVHFPGWIFVEHARLADKVPLMVAIFLLGLFCGYVVEKSGSLWSSVLLHGINNLVSLLLPS